MIRHIILSFVGSLIPFFVFCQYLNLPISGDLGKSDKVTSFSRASGQLKSGEIIKQQLDSIIDYRFDETTGEWDGKLFKRSFSYDDNFNDTLVSQSIWDKEQNGWRVVTKEASEYNELNDIVFFEQHLQSRSGKRLDYSYNDKREVTATTESKWSFDENGWLQIKKTVNKYNTEGVLLSDSLYYKFTDSDSWVPVRKTQYSCNADGKLMADTTYNKPRGSDKWEPFAKTEYEFIGGHLELTTFFKWEADSAKFIPYLKKQIVYYVDDQEKFYVDGMLEYKKNSNSNEWIKIKEKTYGFDDFNLMNTCVNQTWDYDTTHIQEIFSFDYSVTQNDLYLPLALDANEELASHHKITSKQSLRYYEKTGGMEKFRETKYYYSFIESPTEINKVPGTKLKLYPNPASSYILVHFPVSYKQVLFELYNLCGQKVHSALIYNGKKINISSLNRGIYIYNINLGSQIVTGKIIKD